MKRPWLPAMTPNNGLGKKRFARAEAAAPVSTIGETFRDRSVVRLSTGSDFTQEMNMYCDSDAVYR